MADWRGFLVQILYRTGFSSWTGSAGRWSLIWQDNEHRLASTLYCVVAIHVVKRQLAYQDC